MSFPMKPKGLFLNPAKANCSIHESGRMVYDCLKLSEKYDLDYLEVSENQRRISTAYNFYAFNYHHLTMSWLDTKTLSRLPGLKLTFVLETLRNDPFVLCPHDAFDVYCALDPTMNIADKRVYAFPRPLEPAPAPAPQSYEEQEIPVIGTFGFATKGKGFELVVEAVNREFDRAKVRINIPPGTYVNQGYAEQLIELCERTAKQGIEVEVTRDYWSKDQLIQWCAQNTLNCFLYNRNSPGLSATTDQAISSGRPLSVSTNETFRHIHSRIKPYPLRSLKQSIEKSQQEVFQLQQDWLPRKFAARFEEVLEDFNVQGISKFATTSRKVETLGRTKNSDAKVKRLLIRVVKDIAPPIATKSIQRFRNRRSPLFKENPLPQKVRPFVHSLIGSHSQFNEDLLLDLLFSSKPQGFYVDVGANDPTFNNNTKRFYDRGWSGINIEPGTGPYEKLREARPRDINLQLGVGSTSGSLTFYDIPDDPTLSSFDPAVAQRMGTVHGFAVTTILIPVKPLRDILAEHTLNKSVDLLCVDAKGVDLDVLQSNDWKIYRPSLVLANISNQLADIINHLSECEYLLVFNNEYNGLFMDLRTSDTHLKSLLEKNYQ